MNLAKAIAIAANGFLDKRDKSGEPYMLHNMRVMFNTNTTDEQIKIIAMLHDTVEDDVITLKELRLLGFSERVLTAVNLLTHDKGTDYQTYIKAIALNPDARIVKMADLKDNSDITRLKGLTKKDHDRLEKYCIAYTYLKSV